MSQAVEDTDRTVSDDQTITVGGTTAVVAGATPGEVRHTCGPQQRQQPSAVFVHTFLTL